MIVMMLLVLLIIGVLALFKPQEQIAKAKDAKRKNDLNELRKVFEDWYSDKGCYPKKTEVCYNNLSSTTCEICTSQAASPSLEAYTKAVVCDPEPSLKNYLYEINGSANCPTAYLVYTKLSATYAAENDPYNCSALHACGPSPSFWLRLSRDELQRRHSGCGQLLLPQPQIQPVSKLRNRATMCG